MTVSRSILLTCVATATLVACKGSDSLDEGAPPPAAAAEEKPLALEVVGAPVTKGDLILYVNATGQVQSDAIARVPARTSGIVQEVLVQPGDKVSRGQVLARLETTLLNMDLAEAQSGLATAEMNYQMAREDDSLSRRRITPDRERQLRATAGVDNARVRLDRAQFALENAAITAPWDGVVERVGMVVGDRLNGGEVVAVIVDMKNLHLDAQVMEHDIPSLRQGGEATVTIGALPDHTIRGRIAAVLPLVDSIQKYGRALIRFQGDGVIRPGMFASVRLEAARIPGQIIVPSGALVERRGRPLVFVYHGGQADWQYINPGPRNDRQISVLPDTATGIIPLQVGDTVLVAGHRTLIHQTPVKLVAQRDNASGND